MARARCSGAFLWSAAALLLASAASGQVRVGTEFQVNVYTSNQQKLPSIAVDSDGDFVVVWQSILNQDGESYGIFGRRYSSSGAALAAEFQVNTYTTNAQNLPSVAGDADGDFVVVWKSVTQDGFADGIFGQRFSSSGAALGTELQINAYTVFHQTVPRVAADADGDFVVVWGSNYEDGSLWGVFARRFSSAGVALDDDFQVSTYTNSGQKDPSVSVDADGDFVIAWQSNLQDGSGYGVFARRYSSAGTALASEFQVNTYTNGYQRSPSVAIDEAGGFVVAWHSTQDGGTDGVFARIFSSTGVALASEFQVNTYTTSLQRYPSVGTDGAGAFLVVWHSNGQESPSYGVFARRFTSAGAPLTSEFQVNSYTLGYQRSAKVAAEADGDFVVAWASSQDGSAEGIFARRFTLSATLDVDGNGFLEPLTDGLLLLRRQFGFTGSVLTAGAVGAGCTRCDATSIETYITGLGLTVDIDGNGNVGALTDALLVLRFLFGFTGTTLVGGAVDLGGCTRCDAASIQTQLSGLGS